MDAKVIIPMKTVPCPNCRQPAVWQGNPARPFCSERCKLIDLGQWADEKYKITEQDPIREWEIELEKNSDI